MPLISYAAEAPATGLIKAQGQRAVYWVINGVRRPFPLQSVYESHFGASFKDVIDVAPETLSLYAMGRSVTFKKGSVIKIQTDPKVYEVIDDDGSIQWIKTEEEFLSRGFSFKQIRDVPDAFFPDYKIMFATPMIVSPPAIVPPPSNNFTTPTTTASSTPTLPTLKLQNIVVKNKKAADGIKAEFNFTTTLPARAEIQIGYDSGATSTIQLTSSTTFVKEISVLAGSTYNYLVSVTDDSGASATSSGSFMSFADITAKATAGVVAVNAPLLKPLVTVGGFTVTNNSAEKRYLSSMVLGFYSASIVTTNTNKTLSVYRSTGGVAGDLIAQRNIANGTSFLNSQNQQTLAYEDTLAPGQSKSYLIMFSNLDNVNLSLIDGTETFETRLVRLDALGDTTVGISPTPLGTLLHKKP